LTDTAQPTTTIEQSVRIAAPPATVWTFWTDPALLAEWWGAEADVDPQPGGRYRVVMAEGPVMLGTFTELDPPARLVFTFGWEQNAPGEPLAPGSTRVEVTLTPDGEGTVVLLRHTDMPVTHASDHEHGWGHVIGERMAALATRVA
jgi:uncharacterized protein YndB with AHSA1/START domain